MSKKQYIGIIILAVMILGFLFYWYEFRPYQVKKNCFKETTEWVKDQETLEEYSKAYDFYYKNCLRKRGL